MILLGKAFLILLLIVAQTLFFITKKIHLRFELAVPLCLMLDMFILLFFGMVFSNLLLGLYAILLLSVLSILFAYIQERKNLKAFILVFRSPGFIVFVAGYAFCWLVSLRQVTHVWDDFGHWLPFTKQMLNYDKLYTAPEIYLPRHWYYTPAMSLLQYLFCKIAGEYSPVTCFAASTCVIFISTLPVMKWSQAHTAKQSALATGIMFFSINIIAHDDLNGFFLGFGSAYVDLQLTSVCVLLIFWAWFEEESVQKCIYLAIISTFLALIKVTGIMFALLGSGIYIFALIAEHFAQKRNIEAFPVKRAFNINSLLHNITRILLVFIPIIMPIIIYLIWNSHTRPDIEYSSVIRISLDGITFRLHKFGQGVLFRNFTLTSNWLTTYLYYFFTTTINSGAIIQITSTQLLIVFLFLASLQTYLYRTKQISSTRLLTLTACIPLGLLVYNLAIGLSFYSLEENLDTMTSYQRYLASYVGIIVMLIIAIWCRMVFFELQLSRKRRNIAIFLTIATLVITIPSDIVTTVFGEAQSTLDRSRADRVEYHNMTAWGENVQSYMEQESNMDSNIFLLRESHSFPDTPSLDASVILASYFTLPIKMQEYGQVKYNPNPALPFYTSEEWSDVLSDHRFTNVITANFSFDSLVWWQPERKDTISRMYPMFDCPPEEINYNGPLLFEVAKDDKQNVSLKPIIVESLFQ